MIDIRRFASPAAVDQHPHTVPSGPPELTSTAASDSSIGHSVDPMRRDPPIDAIATLLSIYPFETTSTRSVVTIS